jgi:hypothetical protein
VPSPEREVVLGKPNYRHEKRQKELKRQLKQSAKLQRKLDRANVRPEPADTRQEEPDVVSEQ